jgi:hypothetical protein
VLVLWSIRLAAKLQRRCDREETTTRPADEERERQRDDL